MGLLSKLSPRRSGPQGNPGVAFSGPRTAGQIAADNINLSLGSVAGESLPVLGDLTDAIIYTQRRAKMGAEVTFMGGDGTDIARGSHFPNVGRSTPPVLAGV